VTNITLPNIERNVGNLRSILEIIAGRRSRMFTLKSLTTHHDTLTAHKANRYILHLMDAGLVGEYSHSLHRHYNGKIGKRNIIYKRLFDDGIDIDKYMEEMIRNDVHDKKRYRVSHIRRS